jgi:hypothetical protein
MTWKGLDVVVRFEMVLYSMLNDLLLNSIHSVV